MTMVWTEGANTSLPAASQRSTVNAEGQETTRLEPGAETSATVSVFNPDGTAGSESRPDGSSSAYEHDEAGDLAAETEPAEAGTVTTKYDTDLSGQTVATTDPDGSVVTSVYDLAGRLVSNSIGGVVSSTIVYNTLGWTLSQSDSDGTTHTKTYDKAGRVTVDTIGSITTTRDFDGCGREVSRTNSADGSALSRTFDVFGRPTLEVQTGTSRAIVRRTATAWDTSGRVASILDDVSGLQRTFSYAPDGSTTIVETRPGGRAVTSVTDGTGLLRSVSAEVAGVSADWSVTATDSAGRVTDATSSTFVQEWGLAYDQAGRPVRAETRAVENSHLWGFYGWVASPIVVPGGAGSDGSTYGYSPLTGKKNRDSFGFNYQDEWTLYSYDLTGRLTEATRNGDTTKWAYDPVSGALSAYRRPGEATTTLSYDGTGRLTAAGDWRYHADALGRRDWSGPSTNPSETAYAWSGERLTSVSGPGGASDFVYDATGQRIRSVTVSGSITTTTSWTYDGLKLLGLSAQRSDGTTYTLDYLYDERGAVFAGIYAASETTAVPFLMVTTDRGDVREYVDTGGFGFAHHVYDPYGNPTATYSTGTSRVPTATAEAIAARQPLRFASYAYDTATGLYYCSQRHYDPAVGAFISKDPARADGEESAYQYCAGDPVGKTDPSGEAANRKASKKILIFWGADDVDMQSSHRKPETYAWRAVARRLASLQRARGFDAQAVDGRTNTKWQNAFSANTAIYSFEYVGHGGRDANLAAGWHYHDSDRRTRLGRATVTLDFRRLRHPRGLSHIHIWACHSGSGLDPLARAMAAHFNVPVSGAMGSVTFFTGLPEVLIDDRDARLSVLDCRWRWFVPSGGRVPPHLPYNYTE